MKKLRITVEGKTYDVTVEVLEDSGGTGVLSLGPPPSSGTTVSTPTATPAPESAAGEPVVSQLAGTVISVSVTVGQTVAAGDALLVLEAMKMNTSVIAPRAGTVTSIDVAAGAIVEEGQTLLTLA